MSKEFGRWLDADEIESITYALGERTELIDLVLNGIENTLNLSESFFLQQGSELLVIGEIKIIDEAEANWSVKVNSRVGKNGAAIEYIFVPEAFDEAA